MWYEGRVERGCIWWIPLDCDKCKGSPSLMFQRSLFEEQSIVLEWKPLCLGFYMSRFVTEQSMRVER